jgi:hypothetical protein
MTSYAEQKCSLGRTGVIKIDREASSTHFKKLFNNRGLLSLEASSITERGKKHPIETQQPCGGLPAHGTAD